MRLGMQGRGSEICGYLEHNARLAKITSRVHDPWVKRIPPGANRNRRNKYDSRGATQRSRFQACSLSHVSQPLLRLCKAN